MKLLNLAARIAFLFFLCVVVSQGAEARSRHRPPSGTLVMQIGSKNDPIRVINDKIKSDLAKNAIGAATSSATDPLEGIMSAISKPFKDLADFIAGDATGAAALSVQIPALQDTNGQACWLKMQAAGAVFQAHPVPVTLKVMTDFEALRLLQMTANNLCSYTPCTVVFSDGANLAVAAASAAGGALTSNAVPSLTQLCARIPQISPMIPASVTGVSAPAVSVTLPTTIIAPAQSVPTPAANLPLTATPLSSPDAK